MQKQGAPAVFDVPAPQYPIESVDKALKILLLLGERSELRLTDVAEYLNVATSTAHRLLAMLQYRGFVRQDPRTRAYRAGTALTGVALSILERFDVRAVLHPFVESLSTEFAETAHLALLVGASVSVCRCRREPAGDAGYLSARQFHARPLHVGRQGDAGLLHRGRAQAALSRRGTRRPHPELDPHPVRSGEGAAASPPPGLCDQQRGKRERDLLRSPSPTHRARRPCGSPSTSQLPSTG